jgi:predicted ATPase
MVLKKIRGFVEQPITFDFPVTAIIGPNGGGKTTIMGAAGCAYKSVLPRRFFAKSGVYDENMQDWSIEYEIVDRTLNAKDQIRRTASFKNLRWNRDAPERVVLVFGVTRTVPVNERSDTAYMTRRKFKVPDGNIVELSKIVGENVSRILGKDVSRYTTMRQNSAGEVILLGGITQAGARYTEFHFGAGESSIIRMVLDIEAAPDNCLILIEEIENGLHPVATIRLVEYLIEVAERKRVQVIFTTHSNEALAPLPSQAIWAATQDRILQGKLDITSLRALTGEITKSAAVFVEDAFAKLWVEAMLRAGAPDLVDHVEVHFLSGDGIAVGVNKHHNRDPSVAAPSICVIDGDSRQITSDEDWIFRLPGTMPEEYIFDKVMESWEKIGGKLTVALWKEFEKMEEVRAICQNARRQNMDMHLIFDQVGERIGLVPGQTVAGAFCTIWAQTFPEETKAQIENIRKAIAAFSTSHP